MNRDKPMEHWPFDPMQPGDHEPARRPEELERIQKQTGGAARPPSPDSRSSEEKSE